MATYPAIDGMPTHASAKMLTRILRQELGLRRPGVVRRRRIGTLVYEGLAATQKEAALGLAAGVDVGISYETAYMLDLVGQRAQGQGAYGASWTGPCAASSSRSSGWDCSRRSLVDPQHAGRRPSISPAHQELALQAAREAIVLLKNEKHLLPLKKTLRSIAVIGPNADVPGTARRLRSAGRFPSTSSRVLEGISRPVSPETKVTYVKGCDVDRALGPTRSPGPARPRPSAEVAVVVIGETALS